MSTPEWTNGHLVYIVHDPNLDAATIRIESGLLLKVGESVTEIEVATDDAIRELPHRSYDERSKTWNLENGDYVVPKFTQTYADIVVPALIRDVRNSITKHAIELATAPNAAHMREANEKIGSLATYLAELEDEEHAVFIHYPAQKR